GLDFVVQRKLDTLRERHAQLEDELKDGAEASPEKTAALAALVDEINGLTAQLYNPGSEVRVLNGVLEGTVIEMGHASLTVTKPLKAQSFKLSADGKTVQVMPLVAGKPETPA